MKIVNPFRTKRIVISTLERDFFIAVPFIGKITTKAVKRKGIKGRKIKMVIIDEATKISEDT